MELALDASIAVSALGISEWRGGFDWSPMNFGEGTAKFLAVGRGGDGACRGRCGKWIKNDRAKWAKLGG